MKPTEGPYEYHPADKRIVGPVRDHKLSRRPVSDGGRYPEMITRDVIAYVACPNAETQDANGRLLAKSWEMRRFIERLCELGKEDNWEAMPQLVNDEGGALLASIDGDSQ